MPTKGNALCMMKLAEGDIVDKFIDATNVTSLNNFVRRIKSLR